MDVFGTILGFMGLIITAIIVTALVRLANNSTNMAQELTAIRHLMAQSLREIERQRQPRN